MTNTIPKECKNCKHLFYAFTNNDKIPCCSINGKEINKTCELYSFMVNEIENLQKKVGIMNRHDAIAYFIGYFNTISEKEFNLINKLYYDGIIKE